MKTILITENQFKGLVKDILKEQYRVINSLKEYNNNLLLESTSDYWPGRSDDGTSDILSDITDKTSKIQNKELKKKEKEIMKYKSSVQTSEQDKFFQKWMYANMITTSLQDGFFIKPELIEKSLNLYKELMKEDIDKMFEKDSFGLEKFKKTIPVIIKELEKLIKKGPITSGPTYKEMGEYFYSPGFLEERKNIHENIHENIIIESKKKSNIQRLKDNKIPLTPEERDEVMKSKATWNFSPSGKPSPAVWKSKDKNGKITYVTNSHRAFNTATTLKGVINRFHKFIKGTS